MKFIAGVLAFFVLYMSVKPEVDAMLTLTETECCISDSCTADAEDAAPVQEGDDNSCDSGLCNPFLPCCTGIGVVLNFSAFEVFEIQPTAEKILGCESNFKSQFAPDFWHPPKIG